MQINKLYALAFLTIALFLSACSHESELVKFQKETDVSELIKLMPQPNITVNVEGNTTTVQTGDNTLNGGDVTANGGNASGGSASTGSISSGNSNATGQGGSGGSGGTSSAGNSSATTSSNANNSGSSNSTNSSTNSGSASNQANNSTSNSSDNSNGVNQTNTQINQQETNVSNDLRARFPNQFEIEVDKDGKHNCDASPKVKRKRGCHKIKLEKGLSCKVFDLRALVPNSIPNYDILTPVATIVIDQFDVIDSDYSNSFPKFPNNLKYLLENYGLSCSGVIRAPETSMYTFYLTSDDGSKLFVNDRLLIDNDGLHSTRAYLNSIPLTKGDHNIKIDYFQGPRNRISLILEYSYSNKPRSIVTGLRH